jgi:murein DD-endopeptidase MepM/ murein hydrolase activator NlpD
MVQFRRSDFPKLTTWLRDEPKGVEQRNPQAWRAFLEYGQINPYRARDVLSDADGPALVLQKLGSTAFGQFSLDHPDQVVLAQDLAQHFETDWPGDSRIAALIEAKLLHELVHWGDFLSGSNNLGHGEMEWGRQFESAAYGEIRDRYWAVPDIAATIAEVKPVPGVSFAMPTAAARYWPVKTTHSRGREIAYKTGADEIIGAPDRRFMARRLTGLRHHVGVDLWANAGDPIIACEDGTVVNHYLFDDGTYALIVQCDSGLVINYGEVAVNSWTEFGVAMGNSVRAGQAIARVGRHASSGSAMCHFESYRKGTKENHKWLTSAADPPAVLLNPTKYLLKVAQGL